MHNCHILHRSDNVLEPDDDGYGWDPLVPWFDRTDGGAPYIISYGRNTNEINRDERRKMLIWKNEDGFGAMMPNAPLGMPESLLKEEADSPLAIATASPMRARIGQPVTLHGHFSSLSEITNVRWRQLAGPPVALKDEKASETSFVPSCAGRYVFHLTVTNAAGERSNEVSSAPGNWVVVRVTE